MKKIHIITKHGLLKHGFWSAGVFFFSRVDPTQFESPWVVVMTLGCSSNAWRHSSCRKHPSFIIVDLYGIHHGTTEAITQPSLRMDLLGIPIPGLADLLCIELEDFRSGLSGPHQK